jgi:hypothetical protein
MCHEGIWNEEKGNVTKFMKSQMQQSEENEKKMMVQRQL